VAVAVPVVVVLRAMVFPGAAWPNSTSMTARSDGARITSERNSWCSTRPLSPPTSFIRAPGSWTLNTRVLAVLVSHSRTTSPVFTVSE
jgi:hypothetical protein